ncbi:MAG: SH3 domain-containing protein, partial [Phycisphaerae bacterium]
MPQRIAYARTAARRPFFARFAIASAVGLVVGAAMPATFAQPAPAVADGADVENSKFTTTGIIQSNAVFVRCGPGDNYYPTMKLDKGTKVKVVGARFDWLKVVPPEGSFCYVAKLYVDRHGVGQVGRVNKDSINVRAGSSLSALKIG